MRLVATTPEPVTTPNATMTPLAAPSLGTEELSVWRVEMAPGAVGPEHTVDREQIWTVTHGALEIAADTGTLTVSAGRSAALRAGTPREIRCPGGEPAGALVAMAAAGRVTTPADPEPRPLPWAR
ncbi:Cupin domain protein [Streptomyces zhaozhouensis]|uniref:Cupin domain protein n=1 Tax=Streptomyces zhaozhouensis TaxID=1300267 RepID=A0A286DYS4_9ACTN|nr:cupin domain-containing protein [Streptomyces zhaozhouensis]SOD63809.1 Cupin domain protein [Streptomyces zhaozhouensis]